MQDLQRNCDQWRVWGLLVVNVSDDGEQQAPEFPLKSEWGLIGVGLFFFV
jgi:hypothetical protein